VLDGIIALGRTGRLALLEKLVTVSARWLGIRRSIVVYWQALNINQQSPI
jgi:hypothetical protein